MDHPAIREGAIWVKENESALQVAGAAFFFMSFVAAILWISGWNAEPIAFVMLSVSTALFAAKGLATRIEPDQKSVRRMTLDEILEYVADTDPERDWRIVSTFSTIEAVLNEDPRLRIKLRQRSNENREPFFEDWAIKFPDSKAYREDCYLTYDGEFVHWTYCVSVDGSRGILPLPEVGTQEVTRLRYVFSKAVDQLGSFDDYFRRAGLSIVEDSSV